MAIRNYGSSRRTTRIALLKVAKAAKVPPERLAKGRGPMRRIGDSAEGAKKIVTSLASAESLRNGIDDRAKEFEPCSPVSLSVGLDQIVSTLPHTVRGQI
jgi:hypothetical protein